VGAVDDDVPPTVRVRCHHDRGELAYDENFEELLDMMLLNAMDTWLDLRVDHQPIDRNFQDVGSHRLTSA
jgi:hypothetical protein